MTWKDTLEIGLKEDAPYRKDNLPDRQVRGPEKAAGPGRSPEITMARDDRTQPPRPLRARPRAPRGAARRGRATGKPHPPGR